MATFKTIRIQPRKTGVQDKFVNSESGTRFYVADIPYQEHLQKTTQKYLDSVRKVKASEFKKPYASESYPEMEHFSSQPPGVEPPPTPDEWINPDCKLGWEAAGAIDGWRLCAPHDDCAGWVFTCAHKITSLVCNGCSIVRTEELPNDRLLVIICSDEDEIEVDFKTRDGETGKFEEDRECIGENPYSECTSCDDCISDYLGISYTSQQMQVSGTQALSVNPALRGAGGPYSWAIISGGGSLSITKGDSTVYTAPATNPNCASNPTIQVTDYCGNTATLQIAVNAYDPEFAIWANEFNGTYPGSGATVWRGRRVLCDGTYGTDVGLCSACDPGMGVCVQCSDCDPVCQQGCCVTANNCWPWPSEHPVCGVVQCCAAYGDVRDADMKSGGCCPQQMFSEYFYTS